MDMKSRQEGFADQESRINDLQHECSYNIPVVNIHKKALKYVVAFYFEATLISLSLNGI